MCIAEQKRDPYGKFSYQGIKFQRVGNNAKGFSYRVNIPGEKQILLKAREFAVTIQNFSNAEDFKKGVRGFIETDLSKAVEEVEKNKPLGRRLKGRGR